jgi:inner membrane protein
MLVAGTIAYASSYSIPASIFFALLPDIDHPYSTISRFSHLNLENMEHRGIVHTPFTMLFILFWSWLLVPSLMVPVIIGFGSHLLLDMLTPTGIKPFLPLCDKTISLKLIRTGSEQERFLFIITLIVLLAIYFHYDRFIISKIIKFLYNVFGGGRWVK